MTAKSTSAELPDSRSDSLDGSRLDALAQWLAPHLPAARQGLTAKRMDGGQSNPAWLLCSTDSEVPEAPAWVLRAKPAPQAQLLPSAHAIEREFRVQKALGETSVPVPRVHTLCEDESVIGVAFYVMDFVSGRIFRDVTLAELSEKDRAACYEDANRVLSALHCVDWRKVGLQDYGPRHSYFSRLIRRWTQQYQATIHRANPAMEYLMEWLPEHIPPGADSDAETCITHGDFRMENLMFHPSRPEVVAVLDWELSTLGHPFGDLAYNCLAWHMPTGILRGFCDVDVRRAGLPMERDYVARYCDATGRSLDAVRRDWPFYLAFNLFRLSAILQGIGHRARSGTSSNATALEIAAMAEPVAQWGWNIAKGNTVNW